MLMEKKFTLHACSGISETHAQLPEVLSCTEGVYSSSKPEFEDNVQ